MISPGRRFRNADRGRRYGARSLRTLWRCRKGVSATEFGLLAPVLFFSFLAMVDVGFAVYERMTLDQVLRAGAQLAMGDPGEQDVLEVLTATAESNASAFGRGGEDGLDSLTLVADRYCTCPDDLDTEVACSTTCSDSSATSAFYSLRADKRFDGMLIPAIQFAPSMKVQVR